MMIRRSLARRIEKMDNLMEKPLLTGSFEEIILCWLALVHLWHRRLAESMSYKAKTVYSKPEEYYVYSDKGFNRDTNQQGVKIAPDSICYVNSGMTDKDGKMVISHLHKAIKPLNQLRMLEDATVIYRISRAPERRIFYIDVGNLPKMKAEQYLPEIMQKYKNKLVYDAQTGLS